MGFPHPPRAEARISNTAKFWSTGFSLSLLPKVFDKKFFGALYPFLGHYNGADLIPGIGNKSLMVQAVHRVPGKAFSSPPDVMMFRPWHQVKQRQAHFIRFVLIVFHLPFLSSFSPLAKRRGNYRRRRRAHVGQCGFARRRISWRLLPDSLGGLG